MSDVLEDAIGAVLLNEASLDLLQPREFNHLVVLLAALFDEEDEYLDDDQDSPTYDTYVKTYRLKVSA